MLVADEVYWNPVVPGGSLAILRLASDKSWAPPSHWFESTFRRRRLASHLVTPYAAIGNPNTLEYTKKAIALVDYY